MKLFSKLGARLLLEALTKLDRILSNQEKYMPQIDDHRAALSAVEAKVDEAAAAQQKAFAHAISDLKGVRDAMEAGTVTPADTQKVTNLIAKLEAMKNASNALDIAPEVPAPPDAPPTPPAV